MLPSSLAIIRRVGAGQYRHPAAAIWRAAGPIGSGIGHGGRLDLFGCLDS